MNTSAWFFAPSMFEVPRRFRTQVKTFGMGARRAHELVQSLNQISEAHLPDSIWVIGCSGALHPRFHEGDTLEITHLSNEQGLEPVKRHVTEPVILFTAEEVLSSPASKALAFQQTQADLVDMESAVLWLEAQEPVRKRLRFARGVLDRFDDHLILKSDSFWTFLNPLTWWRFFQIFRRWRAYLSGMEKFLEIQMTAARVEFHLK